MATKAAATQKAHAKMVRSARLRAFFKKHLRAHKGVVFTTSELCNLPEVRQIVEKGVTSSRAGHVYGSLSEQGEVLSAMVDSGEIQGHSNQPFNILNRFSWPGVVAKKAPAPRRGRPPKAKEAARLPETMVQVEAIGELLSSMRVDPTTGKLHMRLGKYVVEVGLAGD